VYTSFWITLYNGEKWLVEWEISASHCIVRTHKGGPECRVKSEVLRVLIFARPVVLFPPLQLEMWNIRCHTWTCANICVTMNGRSVAQAVSRPPVIAEVRVRALVSPCGICSGRSGARTGFSTTSSVFRCHYHSIAVHCSHMYQKWNENTALLTKRSVGSHSNTIKQFCFR
jgi:hypothetical protein